MRARSPHRLPGYIPAALSFVLSVSVAPAWAQQPPKAYVPARPAPRTIVLPSKLVAGGAATLAVLDGQGRFVPNVSVELPGSQTVTTDVTGRAAFRVAMGPGELLAKAAGGKVFAVAQVVAADEPPQTSAATAAASPATVNAYPRALALRERFTIEGSGFRGIADSNRVSLNGDPCLILASSPVSLTVLPGVKAPVGDAALHVVVAGSDAGSFPVSVVLLEFSGPAESVTAGSTSTLMLRARGTSEPLSVEIRNTSPSVVQLPKGNVQRVKTSGGDENVAPVDMKFLSGGNYAVLARLISPNTAAAEGIAANPRGPSQPAR